MTHPASAIERIFREEYGRVVASLVRRFGDIDIAEDAASEALLVAFEKWPVDGTPPNPGAWLTTTAGNKAIDRIRRERQRDAKHEAAHMMYDDTPHEPTGIVEDDRLRLIFTCCHPALAPEARVALTLRLLGGLTVPEIAQAFLVPETTMAQRITRAKAKIKGANIPYKVPDQADLAERLATVLAVLYLVFNEGYLASSGEAAVREDLTAEAIRLARILRSLLPDVPEVTGLLALMLLTESRRATREAGGELVVLHEQDRGGWDRELIAEGHELVRECLRRQPARPLPDPGRDQRGAHRRADRGGHRLVPDRHPLRAAVRRGPVADRRAQPGGRGGRARRPGGRPGDGRRAAADDVPRLARDPRRPAPPARPQRRGPGGVRRGDRGHRQRGRACLPQSQTRVARRRVVLTWSQFSSPQSPSGRNASSSATPVGVSE